jgi:hypothetical protein
MDAVFLTVPNATAVGEEAGREPGDYFGPFIGRSIALIGRESAPGGDLWAEDNRECVSRK